MRDTGCRRSGVVALGVCALLALIVVPAPAGAAVTDSTEPTETSTAPTDPSTTTTTSPPPTSSDPVVTAPTETLLPQTTEPTESTDTSESTDPPATTSAPDTTEPTASSEPPDSSAPDTTDEPIFAPAVATGEHCNTNPITIGETARLADPYPSTITVSGEAGFTREVTVQLADFNHEAPQSLDILLVGPSGENVVLMSDVSGLNLFDDPDTLTFVDDAPVLTMPLETGSYHPVNNDGPADTWPLPAPQAPLGTTELETFVGTDPNGTWSLYIVDQVDFFSGGSIAGGWCLTIESADTAGEQTVTALTSEPNPSQPGGDVVFTATVTAGGVPVTGGTVSFTEGSTTLATVDLVDGQAAFTTADLTVGQHVIRAAYGGADDFLPSSATLTHFVDPAPTVTPAQGMYCNNGPIAVPGPSQTTHRVAEPYPSTILVSGADPSITRVTVQLGSITMAVPWQLHVLLVSPSGDNVILMSDVFFGFRVVDINLAFADGASTISGPPRSGVFQPTDLEVTNEWLAPAPTPSGATALSTFNSTDPNGIWRLYVISRGAAGSIGGGWCLSISTEGPAATDAAVLSSPNASRPGDEVTFTATVISDGAPVTDGTVTFSDQGTMLGTVDVDAQGRAAISTAGLAAGEHTITATYGGTTGFFPSTGTTVHFVVPDVVSSCANNPITVPDRGTATPYPSTVTLSGLRTFVTDVVVQLTGVAHTNPGDLDIMLAAPRGENVVLLSDIHFDPSGPVSVSGVNLAFVDGGQELRPPLTSGTYSPLDEITGDSWPAPAPQSSGSTALATFDGIDPNGTWSLFVVDDFFDESGSIAGWCLSVASIWATETSLESSANPSVVGEPVTFTAVVTNQGQPVTEGTVTFTDDSTTPATVLAADVPLDDGVATATVDGLALGDHEISATYSGAPEFGPSTASLIQVVAAETAVSLSSSPNPSQFGEPVTFTATVTNSGAPVTDGTVTFVDATTSTALASNVELDAQGRATAETSSLAVGSHLVTAFYTGTARLPAAQSDPLTHVVEGVADAGGPYTIGEGDDLTLDASATRASTAASYSWDLDGDGGFGDATGVSPTVRSARLVALGIDDGDGTARPITLRVTDGAESFDAVTALTILNVAASVTFDGPTTATVGVPYTIKIGADDPSAADMAGTFVYTVDWGDGSPPLTVSGPADPPVTHTYTTAGVYTLSATVTDPDGATSEPATLTVTVTPQSTTTTSTTKPASGSLPRTGGRLTVAAIAAGAAVAIGALTLVMARGLAAPKPRRS